MLVSICFLRQDKNLSNFISGETVMAQTQNLSVFGPAGVTLLHFCDTLFPPCY